MENQPAAAALAVAATTPNHAPDKYIFFLLPDFL
jgi:hypothetical protein